MPTVDSLTIHDIRQSVGEPPYGWEDVPCGRARPEVHARHVVDSRRDVGDDLQMKGNHGA